MIYTVTFNPSLDYLIHIDDFKPGEVNRMSFEQIYPGGKGINVSIVLKELGCESTALGFAAGFTGDEIQRQLQESGVRSDFIHLPSGTSRINVKLKTPGSETDMNGQGPEIPQEKIEELFKRLDALTENDFLVISGSIPGSLPDDIYEQTLKRLKGKSIPAAVDATGELLTNVLPY
ncbi:MAG: 1-phosphofructokinase family hexose kinase, partial [Eubacterium sp.]